MNDIAGKLEESAECKEGVVVGISIPTLRGRGARDEDTDEDERQVHQEYS